MVSLGISVIILIMLYEYWQGRKNKAPFMGLIKANYPNKQLPESKHFRAPRDHFKIKEEWKK